MGRPAVRILLNGNDHGAPDGATVLALLETIGRRPGQVAVELNGRVVRRGDFSRVALAEGDRVEIVHFVGGG
jgi:thiamine biosynthesis protein ThiS